MLQLNASTCQQNLKYYQAIYKSVLPFLSISSVVHKCENIYQCVWDVRWTKRLATLTSGMFEAWIKKLESCSFTLIKCQPDTFIKYILGDDQL